MNTRLFSLTILILTGCAQMTSLQTGRTLPPQKLEVVGGGGYAHYPAPTANTSASHTLFPTLIMRYGLLNKIDAGIRLIGSTPAVQGKFQLIDSDAIAISLGAEIAYRSGTGSEIKDSDVVDTNYPPSDYSFLIPIFLSYDISPAFSVYVSPKYLFRHGSRAFLSATPANGQYFGLTGGIKVGGDMGAFLEASYIKDLKSAFQGTTLAAAFFMRTGGEKIEEPQKADANNSLLKARLLSSSIGFGTGHFLLHENTKGMKFLALEGGAIAVAGGGAMLSAACERCSLDLGKIVAIGALVFWVGTHIYEIVDIWQPRAAEAL